MPETAYLLVALLFTIYGLGCAIECGIALIRLFPELSPNAAKRQAAFTPLWEITNVFLVFGFTGFTVLFNNAIVTVSQAVLPVLSLSAIALLVRATLVLYLFYNQGRLGRTWQNSLFAVTSLTVPLSFAAAGIHLLQGQAFWQSASGWALEFICLILLIGIGLSFESQNRPTRFGLEIICMTLALASLAFLIPNLLSSQFTRLGGLKLASLTLSSGALLTAYLFIQVALRRYTWVISSLTGLTIPLLLAWLQMPYLSYPAISIDAAYGAQAYGIAVVIGLILSLPLLILGFLLFRKLYREI